MSAPDVAGLTPAEQHAAVLQTLAELDYAGSIRHGGSWQLSRDRAALLGRRAIIERHAPRCLRAADLRLCERLCSAWPCTDYLHAAAGTVVGLPPAEVMITGPGPLVVDPNISDDDTCADECATADDQASD